ncbi:Mudr family transposase [Thalictrum thalictroides]|uniref:Mudr family transposase n=1 Tax=Thalictrum thalictroides TaxID=46969 RepID=A0A7J6VB34_THATH|nr:Mudr family transposase [Thalictrum thalictroides]
MKKEQDGCKWRIHASPKYGLHNFFVIKKMGPDHSGGGVIDVKNPPMTSKLVKFLIGKELAIKEIHGNDTLSHHQLVWFAETSLKTNPGSRVVLESDPSTHKFERIFIAFEACISGFKYCRPMVALDGTFLKGKFKGCLLSATAKNGNQGIYPLAMAVVLSENEANWRWFLENLKMVVALERKLTFLSDRHCGLLSSIPTVFPDSYHSYCYWHMKNNLSATLTKKNRKRDWIIKLFTKCAYAATHVEFQNCFADMIVAAKNVSVNEFFARAPVEHWANAYFRGSRYGNMCSNIAESFNAMIVEERSLPITSMLDMIRVKLMRMMSKRREKSREWTTILCPKMEKLLKERVQEGRTWRVTKSSDYVFEVHTTESRQVDLQVGRCTCNMWSIEGFPCAHAIRCMAIGNCDVYSFYDPYYHSSTYRDSYAHAIYPIPDSEKPRVEPKDPILLPPDCKRAPGRPAKKRKESRGVVRKKMIKCGTCKNYGHNRRTCSFDK